MASASQERQAASDGADDDMPAQDAPEKGGREKPRQASDPVFKVVTIFAGTIGVALLAAAATVSLDIVHEKAGDAPFIAFLVFSAIVLAACGIIALFRWSELPDAALVTTTLEHLKGLGQLVRLPGLQVLLGRLLLGVFAGVLATLLTFALGVMLDLVGPAPKASPDCSAPTQVTVLTTAENYSALSSIGREFEAADARGNANNCNRTRIAVNALNLNHEGLSAAFRKNWGDRASLGSRPDVWLPGSSLDVDLVLDGLGAAHSAEPGKPSYPSTTTINGVTFARFGSVATSPLVVARPADSMAAEPPPAQGLSSRLPKDLADAAIPDPETSSAGLLYVARLHGAGEHAGQLSKCVASRQGVLLVSEQDVFRHNYDVGQPSDIRCSVAGVGTLDPDYWDDKTPLDYPFVRISWPDIGDPHTSIACPQPTAVPVGRGSADPETAKAAAVCRLFVWLRRPAGASALAEQGLRAWDGTWGSPYNADPNALPPYIYGTRPPGRPVNAELLKDAEDGLASLVSRHIIIAFDMSGTMATAKGNGTRLSAGALAARAAVSVLGRADTVEFWQFHRRLTGRIGTWSGSYEGAAEALDGLTANEHNSNGRFFSVVYNAVHSLRQKYPSDHGDRLAVVVVTDSENEAEKPYAQEYLMAKLDRTTRERVKIVVLMGESGNPCGSAAGRQIRAVAACRVLRGPELSEAVQSL